MKLAVVADVGLLPPPLQAAMEQPDKLGKGEGVQIVDAVRVWAAHVLSGVLEEVTDDKSLDKAVRKRKQVESASRKSERAKIIGLGDEGWPSPLEL